MSYTGLGIGFDISHAGAPYKGMLGLGVDNPMKKINVRSLQKLLLSKGFSVGPTGVDGIWGPNTKAGYMKACGASASESPGFSVEEAYGKPDCSSVEVVKGKRYVKVPSAVHGAIANMPNDPIAPPEKAPRQSPFDLDFQGDGKSPWPWVAGVGGVALLIGGLWWLQQDEPRPVTPNRRRRRRGK